MINKEPGQKDAVTIVPDHPDPLRVAFSLFLSVLALAVVLFAALPAAAGDRILKYDSIVKVNRDGSLQVAETFTARTEKLAKSFFWRLPKSSAGNFRYAAFAVDAAVDGVKADAKAEWYDGLPTGFSLTKYLDILPPGEHVYTTKYKVDRKFSYFLEQDELTWQTTGFRDLPVDRASLTIELPGNVPKQMVKASGSIGPAGAPGRDIEFSRDAAGRLLFTSTRPLAAGEGLTAVLSVPKGHLGRNIITMETERITEFHSLIKVLPDSTLAVTESITVDAMNKEIKHGIYRDFPRRYAWKALPCLPAIRTEVGIVVNGATRDGKPEPFFTKPINKGIRIYLGSEDSFVPKGIHTYTITYVTDRQLGFFPDHDELYWNVTGDRWNFPIMRASATIELPRGIERDRIRLNGYTGEFGSTEQDYTSSIDRDGGIHFSARHPLDLYEGLTIAVSFPKGFVSKPTGRMKIDYLLRDDPYLAAALAGLMLLMAYAFITWLLVGRDPAAGTIMPLYHPPDGLSPAAVRYLYRMDYDTETFVASVLSLAVQGHLRIKDEEGTYTLLKQDRQKAAAVLSPEEQELRDALPGSLKLDSKNHEKIAKLTSNHEETLKRRLPNQFKANKYALYPAVILALLTLVLAAWHEDANAWLGALGWFAGCMFSLLLYGMIFVMFPSLASEKWARAGIILMAPILAIAVAAIFYWAFLMSRENGLPLFFLIMLAVVIGVTRTYFRLIKARSSAGQKVSDRLEGFRMYLAAAEQDRLNRSNPPERTPELFERYLPYALAFDLEQQWAEQFAGVLATAAQADISGSYSWIDSSSRNSFDRLSAAGFASSLGSSLTSAVSSSSSPPGSSSGFGGGGSSGGSSGGGGGGGGGGGW